MVVASASLVYHFFGELPAIALVMIGAFLFYSCRSAGTVVTQPLVGEITTKENRGSFISKSNQLFYFSCLICLAVITCILKFYQDLWTLSLIIFTGSVFGFTSAVFLARIVESGALRNSARQPMLQGAWKTLKDKSRRRLLTANFIVSALTAMTIPAIFYSTGDMLTAVVGTVIALILAYCNCPLILVAVAAAASALLTGIVI